jgi:hypothetical protein
MVCRLLGYYKLKGEPIMKALIIKFKSMLPRERKDEITKRINDSLDSNGFIVLDAGCDYEIVDLERGNENGKE